MIKDWILSGVVTVGIAFAGTVDARPHPDDRNAAQPEPFVVHEWGTFTSLQGSDGRVQPGMHHEEEHLPRFVYGRGEDTGSNSGGSWCDTPKCVGDFTFDAIKDGFTHVTQKLETPVVYFYGKPDTEVDVKVDFPQGIISQWYPKATSYTPEVGATGRVSDGSMTWRGTLAPADITRVPWVDANAVYAPARNVPDALSFRTGGEEERFIFYRGLGDFELPLKVHSEGDAIMLSNDSPETILAAFLMNIDGDQSWLAPLGSVPASQTRRISSNVIRNAQAASTSHEAFVSKAREALLSALQTDGLYPDEAKSMVDTWTRSYFNTSGLRVLYVVPRKWTDALLPISISPKPAHLVRTLVGRIEIMTDAEEQTLLAQIRDDKVGEEFLRRLGRLAEPKLERLKELAPDAETRTKVEALLQDAQAEEAFVPVSW